MCGIFSAWNVDGAALAAFMGIHKIQHRGQESVGILTLNDGHFYREKGIGILSADAIPLEKLSRLKGKHVLAQNRYTTVGHQSLAEAQPFVMRNNDTGEKVSWIHNGQLNESSGWSRTRSDSERFGKAFSHAEGNSLDERIFAMLSNPIIHERGSYAMAMLVHSKDEGDALIVASDPYGNRPIEIGRIVGETSEQDGYIFASESASIQGISLSTHKGLKYVRPLERGEVIILTKKGIRSYTKEDLPANLQPKTSAPCFFEGVYFSAPDSLVFGSSVYEMRRELGKTLAKEQPVDADIVVPVPDSSIYIAEGFSEESGLPVVRGITRSHYIGRTFIDPDLIVELTGSEFTGTRGLSLARKFGFIEPALVGKKVVLVDDSIVRGNTMKNLIGTLYGIGVSEVHLRIGSPPTTHSCFYGINTPKRQQLLASNKTVEEVRMALRAKVNGNFREPTSLGYLSVEGTMASLPYTKEGACNACVTGNYIIPIGELSLSSATPLKTP